MFKELNSVVCQYINLTLCANLYGRIHVQVKSIEEILLVLMVHCTTFVQVVIKPIALGLQVKEYEAQAKQATKFQQE